MMDLQSSPDAANEPNVFQFEDPVDVLIAYIEYKKRKHPNFTVSHWSKKLLLPTSGILFNLIKRRRILTEDLALKIADNLQMDKESTEYFHTLVAWTRAKHCGSKVVPDLKNRLNSLKLQKKSVVIENEDSKKLWKLKTLAIKELILLRPGIHKDEIETTLKKEFSSADIQNALETLLSSRIIHVDEEGYYFASIENLDSQTDVPSETIRAYHRESLDHAKSCLDSVPIDARYFSSYILPIHSKDMAEAKLCIEEFINQFAAKFERPGMQGDSVYQLNMNFVPHAHFNEENRE